MNAAHGRYSLAGSHATIVSLGGVVVFVAVRVITLVIDPSTPTAGTLPEAYSQIANVGFAAFVFGPLFVAASRDVLRTFFRPFWLIRDSYRKLHLGVSIASVVMRALAFSAVLTACSIVGICLLHPLEYPVGLLLSYATVVIVGQALFFLVSGMLMLLAYLMSSSAAAAALIAVCYSALDYLLGMTPLVMNPMLWSGWLLASVPDLSGWAPVIGQFVRLIALVVVLVASCSFLSSRHDVLDEERGTYDA